MKQNKTSLYILFIFLVLFSTSNSLLAQRSAKTPQAADKYLLDATEFKSAIKKKNNIVVVDVRTPEEFEVSHIKGSINFDYKSENFRDEISGLDKSKKYYIYCRSGRRSANSRVIMNDMGFKKVYDLKGGIIAWEGMNYPTE